MARLDWYIHEAVRTPLPFPQEPPRQLSLALFPCLEESLGFLQICHLADAVRRVISHQCRMYYREEFDLWYHVVESYLIDRKVPKVIRIFLTDTAWDKNPPQLENFWFPSMKEIILLTYIVEERGYPVWTPELCNAFFYHLHRRHKNDHQSVYLHEKTASLRSLSTASEIEFVPVRNTSSI